MFRTSSKSQSQSFAGFSAGLILLFSASVYAHHPTITAEAVCTDTGNVTINYTSVAWEGRVGNIASRENPQIDILFNNVKVGQGAYVSPDFSFSDSAPAPAGVAPGDSVVVTAVAVAPWGNGFVGGEQSTTVIIPADCPVAGTGRFTGGGHQIQVDGVRVTRGLTIHCDLLLSNNLEVNWQGNRFHMTEHLTTVTCSDDPDIIQAPPPAPLDTLVGIGTGRFNNVDGYTIEFTLVDAGEPGRSDMAAILIYESGNPSNVVLDIPLQLLSGGNLQAHFDQPHK